MVYVVVVIFLVLVIPHTKIETNNKASEQK